MKKVTTSLLAFATLAPFASAQLPDYVPADGLISWWGFAGNANDQSGHGHHGSVNGALLTNDRFNMPGQAYDFDGINDEINIGNTPDFVTETFTVCGWINSTYSTFSYETLFSYYYQSSPGAFTGYWLGLLENKASLFLGDGLGFGMDISASDSINDGQWHFLTATYNSNHEGSIYVDGILRNTVVYAASIMPTDAQIGNSFLNELFNGKLDDIGVWRRVLSQDEISVLYNGCSLQILLQPIDQHLPPGDDAQFTVLANEPNATYQWQTDVGFGFQNTSDINQYSGSSTPSLAIEKVKLSNHLQPFRVNVSNQDCADTSDVAFLFLTDTCIVTVQDTVHVVVQDTTFVTVIDTSVVIIMDTSFVTIMDTTLIVIIDTTFIEITDTTLIAVTDTLYIKVNLLSVPPQENSNTLKAFPNPANTHLTIDNGDFALMNGYRIRIDNLALVNVFDQVITQQTFEIDLSTWPGIGLYFLYLIDPEGNVVTVRKIVLQ